MEQTQILLQVSAKLYQNLAVIPVGAERDLFIEEIDAQLKERGIIIETLREQGFVVDTNDKSHVTLIELDKGIRERLDKVLTVIKVEMKDIQNSKKNEQQYMNPYSDVRVMDGMYYDKKK